MDERVLQVMKKPRSPVILPVSLSSFASPCHPSLPPVILSAAKDLARRMIRMSRPQILRCAQDDIGRQILMASHE